MKIKIGLIYGGKSNEHEVSIESAKNIMDNLDNDKYKKTAIYINKEGDWYNDDKKINDAVTYLKQFDIVFPILHGKYGEDGTIQGMLEMLNIPYVGCGVLASSIAMDKVYTKIILEKANIKQANYQYIQKYKENYFYIDNEMNETILDINKICKKIETKINYPMFVKPSNSGSSIGISKVNNREELKIGIEEASRIDNKILIEEMVIGREIECAVKGNDEPEASCLGEIITNNSFYTYDAKYNDKSSKTIMPANLDEELTERVRKIAKKAYKAISAQGLARVDFFVNEETKEIYLNEINTMPGFTEISMYPKLWETSGIPYNKLLDELINLALKK